MFASLFRRNKTKHVMVGNSLTMKLKWLVYTCGDPNWDSYGADPITEDAALAFNQWIASKVSPNTDGGFHVEFSFNAGVVGDEGHVEFDISPDGRLDSVYVFRGDTEIEWNT